MLELKDETKTIASRDIAINCLNGLVELDILKVEKIGIESLCFNKQQ